MQVLYHTNVAVQVGATVSYSAATGWIQLVQKQWPMGFEVSLQTGV
jgi:hypothetical protein